MRNDCKGFTLVELIVVMAILGILASMITINVSGVLARERVTRIQADLKLLEVAANQYLYTEIGRKATVANELSQQQLLEHGLLSKQLLPPIEGYQYQITVLERGMAQVVMKNDEGVYRYGEFEADTQAAGFG